MEAQLENITSVWPQIKNTLSVPHTETEYDNLVSMLDSLIENNLSFPKLVVKGACQKS